MTNCIEDGIKRWLCPSDRELTLRAKLSSGWSFRTNCESSINQSITDSERLAIAQVLSRASKLQEAEEERVRNLNERLAKFRKAARGNGNKTCILCNDKPKFLSKFRNCKDCKSCVCSKCCCDSYEFETDSTVYLCKLCFEHRELIKKSNMWLKFNINSQKQ